MNRYILTLYLLCLSYLQTSAQQFGGNAPSLKFFQLNTDTVRIVFPKGLEKEAREIAGLSHQLLGNAPSALGKKFRKYNIVLQNQTTSSNAYVGIAPYRSEFYMMPDLDNISSSAQPWHQSLAVHELRHIHQFSNFNRAIPKLAGVFLGQEGQAVAMGAVVPDWFWEGDAVWQETVVTAQGRGRLPQFFNAYRSLWLESKTYSFQKLRNGSFRNFVPNHYDLGYLLVSYGYEKYGSDFWKNVTADALDLKGLIYPFQHAVKKYSGVSYKKFVDEAFNFYKEKMNVEGLIKSSALNSITKSEKNNVVNYQYPFISEDHSLLVLKSGYKQIPTWVQLNEDGTEKKLRVKDIADDSYYSFTNGKIVYTAYETDPRWGWKDYSVLKVWNKETNEVKKITHHSRLFMPDISKDGEQVVAVQVGTDMKWNLHLVDINTKIQHSIPNPNNYSYTYPKFSGDGLNIISAVRNDKGEMALLQTNVQSGEEKILLPFTNTSLAFIQVYGDTVLFTAAQSEVDQLFLFDRKSNSLFRIADLPNGNYQPAFNAKTQTLVWNTFTAGGTKLLIRKLSELKLERVEAIESLSDLYLSPKILNKGNDLLKDIQQQPGEIKKYSTGTNLLNIHSWRPTLSEPDYGITFYSENILNTFTGEYSYFYNRNEQYHQAAANMIYGGLYPQLFAGIVQTWNRSEYINADTTIRWNQINFNTGFSIPLNLTSGKWYRNLIISSSVNAEKLSFTGIAKTFINNDQFNYSSSSIRWVSQVQKAKQHIFPHWAQSFSLQYRRTIDGKLGNQFLGNAGLYFPGFAKNHNLVLFASYFARDTIRGSRFTNNFAFARGYNAVNFPRMWRFSANYHLPLLYPEFGIGNMIYFMRIRANTFFDYTKGRSLRTGREFPLKSTGVEIYFDTRIWNTFPASFGIRYSRLLDKDLLQPTRNPNQFEFILPLDLF